MSVGRIKVIRGQEELDSADVKYRDTNVKDVLDQILQVTSGLIDINIRDGNYPVHAECRLTNATTGQQIGLSTDQTGKISAMVPVGKYSITVIAPAYNVVGMVIIRDNDTTDNSIIAGATIDNVDIGFFDTVVEIFAEPVELPTLNAMQINNGAATASDKTLNISLDVAGVANEYCISTNSTFTGAEWRSLTSKNFQFVFEYLTNITLTLYVKVRNTLGESDVLSATIEMRNGIYRSDSSKSYNSISDCIKDIKSDYGENLTQDVTVTVESSVINHTDTTYALTIEHFNENSPYYLTIDGNNNLDHHCNTAGGWKFRFVSNLIIKKVRFHDVSNLFNISTPEQMAALFIEGEGDAPISNIILEDIYIDGLHISNDYRGTYGIVVKNIQNLTFNRVEMINIGAIGFVGSNLTAVTFTNCNIHDMTVRRGVTSQPCIVGFNKIEVLLIEDTTFDGAGMDTIFILVSVDRIISRRSRFINAMSEAFRTSGTQLAHLFEFDACYIDNCLNYAYYPWTKYIITFSNVDRLVLKNNTFVLTPVNGSSYYTKLFAGGKVNIIESHNNIFDMDFGIFNNNSGEAVIYSIGNIVTLQSDYNVYHDYSADNDKLANMLALTGKDTSYLQLYRTYKLSAFQALGQDLHSTIIQHTQKLHVGNDKTILDPIVSANIVIDRNYLPKYDIAHNTLSDFTTGGNVGCGYIDAIVPSDVVTVECDGIDLYDDKHFLLSNGTEEIYSNTDVILIPETGSKGDIYRFDIYKSGDAIPVLTKCGVAMLINLLSQVDPNTGQYAGDQSYDIEINKLI